MRLPLVVVLAFVALAVSYNQRMLDPLTALIAREAGYDLARVVLFSPAFTLPYALGQPILGPLADAIGKAKVLRLSMLLILAASAAAYFATDYWTLFGLRFAAGLGAGGIIPVALALIADRTPVEQRQVALSHFMGVLLIGQLYAAPLAAFVAHGLGWQFNFVIAAGMSIFSLGMLFWKVKPNPAAERRPFSIRVAAQTYRAILSLPLARACYLAVFAEGIFIFGLIPHIALLVEARKFGGATEAGYVLAAMGVGGILYAMAIGFLARRYTTYMLMQAGVLLIGAGIAGMALAPGWPMLALSYGIVGFGFFMLHSGLQTRATELMPSARASAVSLHAFSMFIGIASGPPLFGWLASRIGFTAALLIASLGILAICTWAVQFLRRRAAAA